MRLMTLARRAVWAACAAAASLLLLSALRVTGHAGEGGRAARVRTALLPLPDATERVVVVSTRARASERARDRGAGRGANAGRRTWRQRHAGGANDRLDEKAGAQGARRRGAWHTAPGEDVGHGA